VDKGQDHSMVVKVPPLSSRVEWPSVKKRVVSHDSSAGE